MTFHPIIFLNIISSRHAVHLTNRCVQYNNNWRRLAWRKKVNKVPLNVWKHWIAPKNWLNFNTFQSFANHLVTSNASLRLKRWISEVRQQFQHTNPNNFSNNFWFNMFSLGWYAFRIEWREDEEKKNECVKCVLFDTFLYKKSTCLIGWYSYSICDFELYL